MVLALAMTVIAAATTARAWEGGEASSDQVVAQRIADRLSSSGQLKGYSIAVKYKDGRARLEGWVRNQEQLDAALTIVEQSPEVQEVVNQLSVRNQPPVTRAAAGRPQALVEPTADEIEQPTDNTYAQYAARRQAMQPALPDETEMQTIAYPAQPAPRSALPQAQAQVVAQPAPMQPGVQAPVYSGAPLPAYVPGTGGGVAPAVYDQPYLPNYSWPAYAAYPNYGAVTYPRQYSPAAWPYIGPFYPYPQVPLGWRKVTLEWDDGWWFLNFSDNRRHVHN
jgi:hypothetical protein